MKLSIGIPTYNQAEYLEACIESFLIQTYPVYEIVISNNHSTDETNRILGKFGDRIKVIQPDKHLTMMQNWNFCVQNCTGDWFSLMSSDDIALPNFIEVFTQGLQKYPDAVLLRAGFQCIDQEGNVLQNRYLRSVRGWTSPQKAFTEQLLGPKVSFAAFAAQKAAWQTVGGFPENLKLLGDWGFWLLLTQVGGIGYIHQLVSQYRVWERENRFKARCSMILEDELIIIQEIIRPLAAKRGRHVQEIAEKTLQVQMHSLFHTLAAQFSLSELQELKPLLLPCAEAVNTEEELAQLLSGEYRLQRATLASFLQKIKLVTYRFLNSLT